MDIKSVTVGLRRTESLPGYANVQPSISLTAELELSDEDLVETDALERAIGELTETARGYVEGEVDRALEGAGQPAKFSAEVRYTLWVWESAGELVVLPAAVKTGELVGRWTVYHDYGDVGAPMFHGQRWEALMRLIGEEWVAYCVPGPDREEASIWHWAMGYLGERWVLVRVVAMGSARWPAGKGLGEVIIPGQVWLECVQDEDEGKDTRLVMDGDATMGLLRLTRGQCIAAEVGVLRTEGEPVLETVGQVRGWIAQETLALEIEARGTGEAEESLF